MVHSAAVPQVASLRMLPSHVALAHDRERERETYFRIGGCVCLATMSVDWVPNARVLPNLEWQVDIDRSRQLVPLRHRIQWTSWRLLRNSQLPSVSQQPSLYSDLLDPELGVDSKCVKAALAFPHGTLGVRSCGPAKRGKTVCTWALQSGFRERGLPSRGPWPCLGGRRAIAGIALEADLALLSLHLASGGWLVIFARRVAFVVSCALLRLCSSYYRDRGVATVAMG